MNRQPQPQHLPQQPLILQPIVSNNLVLFIAIVGAGAYAVYTVGDLQSVIYAVSGAYALRLLMRNPDIIRQLQEGLSSLQQRPRLSAAQPSQPQPVFAEGIPAAQRDPLLAAGVAPRLEMNFEQVHRTGYQPLPTHLEQVEEFANGTPATPTPSYSQYTGANHRTSPSRAESRASNLEDFPVPARNPYGSYSHYDAGTINGERVAGATLTAAAAPLNNASRPDSRASNVSHVSDFPLPTRNPYGSYSHYDAGTIGGERVVQRVEIPEAYPSLSERIAAPPQRPESSVSMHAENFPLPTKNPYGSYSHYDAGTIGGQLVGRSSSRSSTSSHSHSSSYNPSPLRVETKAQEYVPTRKHRMPTIAARVGEVAAPGGGISPARVSSTSPDTSAKFFNSPLVNSPSVVSPQHSGYDSDSSHDSSHASSSSGHSHERQELTNTHVRSESLGLPTYEKHATTIFTLVPKRPGYVPQIQAILKAARNTWLALPGSVTHEVGQDESTGSVVVVETYETSESMEDFEKSKERESILGRLKNFIDESKTTVVRLPGSSAATRVVR